MSTAVLKEPKVSVDRAAVMRELLYRIDFIADDGLVSINSFAADVLERQSREYVPHSFDDLRDDVKQAIIDAENGINVYGPYEPEEAIAMLHKWAEEDDDELVLEAVRSGTHADLFNE